MFRIIEANGRSCGGKTAGLLHSGRVFALCAQGSELDAQLLPLCVFLLPEVTARGKASYGAYPHQDWK